MIRVVFEVDRCKDLAVVLERLTQGRLKITKTDIFGVKVITNWHYFYSKNVYCVKFCALHDFTPKNCILELISRSYSPKSRQKFVQKWSTLHEIDRDHVSCQYPFKLSAIWKRPYLKSCALQNCAQTDHRYTLIYSSYKYL